VVIGRISFTRAINQNQLLASYTPGHIQGEKTNVIRALDWDVCQTEEVSVNCYSVSH
jgi:hypothetical protein